MQSMDSALTITSLLSMVRRSLLQRTHSLLTGIYSKGKIRCPLHGACFNVKTGDIEDYPGFDSLTPFQVRGISRGSPNFSRRAATAKYNPIRNLVPGWIMVRNYDWWAITVMWSFSRSGPSVSSSRVVKQFTQTKTSDNMEKMFLAVFQHEKTNGVHGFSLKSW